MEPAELDAAMPPAVRRVMRTGVISLPETASLAQVRRAMLQHDVHAILIVSRLGTRPLGWVTATGLLAYGSGDPACIRAVEAISEDPTRIEPGASVLEAARLLCDPGVGRLLVAEGPADAPQGVITDLDVLRALP